MANRTSGGRVEYERAKRLIDVAGAATVLVLSAPVQAVVAGAIRLSMGRPVLFRQAGPWLMAKLAAGLMWSR